MLTLTRKQCFWKTHKKHFGKKVNKDIKVKIIQAINSRLVTKTRLVEWTTYPEVHNTSIAPPLNQDSFKLSKGRRYTAWLKHLFQWTRPLIAHDTIQIRYLQCNRRQEDSMVKTFSKHKKLSSKHSDAWQCPCSKLLLLSNCPSRLIQYWSQID